MALNKDLYRIMAVYPHADVVEALMTQLRDQGLVVRSSLVDDFNTLTAELSTATWDLILLQSPHEHIAISDVLNYLQKIDKDIPVIVLMQVRDVAAITAMIQQGVAQVLTDDLSEVFATVMVRELKQVRVRRALHLLESDHQEIEKRCLLLLESSRDPIAYIADGMHIAVNLVYAQQFGCANTDDISGVPLLDMIAAKDKARFKKIIKQFNQPDALGETVQFSCVRVDGTEFSAQLSFSAATYEGEACIQLMLHEDKLPEPVAAAVNVSVDNEKMLELSRLDVITGLYNRFHFEAELEKVVADAVREHKSYALFYVQLAGYNKLRAKMGVDGIDQVGKEMATLLRTQFADQEMMSRFSEDVYVVLAKQMRIDETYLIAEALCKRIEAHLFDLKTQTFRFTSCIGVALSDASITESKELLVRAMRAAAQVETEKASNGFTVFVKTMEAGTDAPVVSASQELQKAFENNLFKIFFQPIINLRGSSTEFYEVLLRRVNEQGGFESPEQFLKTAAASQIAGIVDRWVIIQSIKTLIARRAQGHSTRILINLTAQSLQDKTLLPWLTVALKTTLLPKESVTFQVNEEDASTHLKRVQELGDSLKALDCHLGVSRFGSSENSLTMLKHVNLNYVKLDGSFTKNIHQDHIQTQFKEIVQLLHQHNIKSIAPLVESANVLSVLWQVGVDYIQGYYLQPPMEGMNYDFNHDGAE